MVNMFCFASLRPLVLLLILHSFASQVEMLKQSKKSGNWNMLLRRKFSEVQLSEAQARGPGNDDYWSENFDQEQNCVQKDRIAELQGKVEFQTLLKLSSRITRLGVKDHVTAHLRWSRIVFMIIEIRIRRTRHVLSTCARWPSQDRFLFLPP